MPTYVRGTETTENIPSARRVRDVSDSIFYLDPNAGPFTLITQQAASRVAVNSKFEWIEAKLPDRWDQINNGAGYNTTATSLVVDNAAYWSVGDVGSNVRTGEKFRVTTVTTGTQTLVVVRAVDGDGVNGVAMLDNDDLQIVGNAYAEGANAGAPKAVVETYPFNYTQIFRNPFGATGTQEASENYGGKTRPRLRMEKAIEHKILIEQGALFGERNLDNSNTAAPFRYTGGLLYFLTSNNQNMGGVMTEPEVENFMQNVFGHVGGSDTRLLLASPLAISVIDQLAQGRVNMAPSDKTFGIAISQWVTSHGTLLIAKDRLLENGPGGLGYGGYMIAVDVKHVKYRFLSGRTTALRMDIQNNDADAWEDEYLTECGWEVELPDLHGVATGITG